MTGLPSGRFGDVIRQSRQARGWSQERLAGTASINRSCMGEIERATAIPTLASAEKLAQALGVPLSDLILRCEEAIASADFDQRPAEDSEVRAESTSGPAPQPPTLGM